MAQLSLLDLFLQVTGLWPEGIWGESCQFQYLVSGQWTTSWNSCRSLKKYRKMRCGQSGAGQGHAVTTRGLIVKCYFWILRTKGEAPVCQPLVLEGGWREHKAGAKPRGGVCTWAHVPAAHRRTLQDPFINPGLFSHLRQCVLKSAPSAPPLIPFFLS